jgi:hypothetical protein
MSDEPIAFSSMSQLIIRLIVPCDLPAPDSCRSFCNGIELFGLDDQMDLTLLVGPFRKVKQL